MATPSLVTIHGSSTLHRPAERAIVTIRVHSEGSSQQQVSKEVRNRITELRGILTKMALKDKTGEATPEAPITHWSMEPLLTGPTEPRDKEGRKLPREFTATTTFSVSFRNFVELGKFASMLSTQENVSIQQISWELTDDTKASLGTESRVLAVKDAVDKAKDCSKALGRGKVTVTIIIPGTTVISNPLLQSGDAGHGPEACRQEAGGAGSLRFATESVSFTCNVTVKYKIA